MISLDKCNGSRNSIDDLSAKIYIPDVKVFNMVTKINEPKTLNKHIYAIVNASLTVQHVILIKNEIMKHVNVNVNTIISTKIIIVGTLA